MTASLHGIRVVDFGRFIAAPYCAMLLADFGADVIRVEKPGGGEDRFIGPVTSTGEGGLFLGINRNKRGIAVDIGDPRAGEIKSRLIAGADIVTVNLPPFAQKKLGLDYGTLSSIRPDIIAVMATAFGGDGPGADRPGFDTVAQAMSGAMSLTGTPGPPQRSVVPYVDFATALHGAFGAILALRERERTGRGGLVEVSLLSTAVAFMQPYLAELAVSGIVRRQQGNTGFFAAPSDAYRTLDGWVMVPTVGNDMFRRWAKLVGREDLLDDPDLATDDLRSKRADLINGIMGEWCAVRTREQVLDELEQARLPCGPVHGCDEVLADEQVRAMGLLEAVEHPDSSVPVPVASTPVRWPGAGGSLVRAPKIGEHTGEVLTELGFEQHEIDGFRSIGVI